MPTLEHHEDIDTVSETVRIYSTDAEGLRQGGYRLETITGELIERAQYIDNRLDGDRTVYRSDGTIERHEHYHHGVLVDTMSMYYPSGIVMLRMPYENGRIQGVSCKYDVHGALMERVTFVDNEENGPFEEYHTNGTVHWRGTYLNGPNEYGPLYEYDSTGILIKEMICDSSGVCRTVMEK